MTGKGVIHTEKRTKKNKSYLVFNRKASRIRLKRREERKHLDLILESNSRKRSSESNAEAGKEKRKRDNELSRSRTYYPSSSSISLARKSSSISNASSLPSSSSSSSLSSPPLTLRPSRGVPGFDPTPVPFSEGARDPALLLTAEVVKSGAGVIWDTLSLEPAPNRSAESFFRLDRGERSDGSLAEEIAELASEGVRERSRLRLVLGVLETEHQSRNENQNID